MAISKKVKSLLEQQGKARAKAIRRLVEAKFAVGDKVRVNADQHEQHGTEGVVTRVIADGGIGGAHVPAYNVSGIDGPVGEGELEAAISEEDEDPEDNDDGKSPIKPAGEVDEDDDDNVLDPSKGDDIGSVLNQDEEEDPDHDGDDDSDHDSDQDSDSDSEKDDEKNEDDDDEEDDDDAVDDDLEDILNKIQGDEDEPLPESFKRKAAAVFEAAVLARVKKEAAKIEKRYAAKINESASAVRNGLSKQLNGYLDYVVEQWMTDNKIAIESGMKVELMENFITGMHKLFAENYVAIPDDRVDMVAKLEAQLAEAKKNADEAINENLELKESMQKALRDGMIEEAAEGLSALEVEKFKTLVEGVAFKSEAAFVKKLGTIRESYFKSSVPSKSPVTDSPVQNDAAVSAKMKAYVKALSE